MLFNIPEKAMESLTKMQAVTGESMETLVNKLHEIATEIRKNVHNREKTLEIVYIEVADWMLFSAKEQQEMDRMKLPIWKIPNEAFISLAQVHVLTGESMEDLICRLHNNAIELYKYVYYSHQTIDEAYVEAAFWMYENEKVKLEPKPDNKDNEVRDDLIDSLKDW